MLLCRAHNGLSHVQPFRQCIGNNTLGYEGQLTAMQVDARDAEGRTALHLAAGCGDSAMVLQLVSLAGYVNCRDSVGGNHENKPINLPIGAKF